MKNNQAGFTLIESMIVLSVFLLIVSLSFILLKPHYHLVEKERFFTAFTSDILYAQQYAISKQSRLVFHIQSSENRYYVREKNTNKFIVDRSISDSIKIENGTLGIRSITFDILPDGGISEFGTIFVVVEKVRYKMVFQIGVGRFYVVKE